MGGLIEVADGGAVVVFRCTGRKWKKMCGMWGESRRIGRKLRHIKREEWGLLW